MTKTMPKILLFTAYVVAASSLAAAQDCPELPGIQALIDLAFPPWNVDENGARIEGGGKWTPIYLTKRWDGLDPSMGGHPTDTDTRYPFYYASPFLGQPGGGGNRHCPEDYPVDAPIQSCSKVITDSDDGEWGPGHIPPHIALASVRMEYAACEMDISTWFDFTSEDIPCDIKPDVLLQIIRKHYPRDPKTGKVDYPPPSNEGTKEYYELEFPSPSGSPHYCSEEYAATGQTADFCPYIYEGENRGKYRHPHIALAALQQYLANKLDNVTCGVEWDDRGNYPADPDHSIAFCEMESYEPDAQPAVPYVWPENGDRKVKNVTGLKLWSPPNETVTTGESSGARAGIVIVSCVVALSASVLTAASL